MKIPKNFSFYSSINSLKNNALYDLKKRYKTILLKFTPLKQLFLRKKNLFFVISSIVLGLISLIIFNQSSKTTTNASQKKILIKVVANYKKKIDGLAKDFDIPPSYLLAVIALESSGRKKVPVRFEKGIYEKLIRLKNGKINQFENLKTKDVKKLSTAQLKALASSYGPFQIMGYKCFILNISLNTLRGKKHLYYAVKWINLTYGDLLRAKNYKDAFHIHNAGSKYPDDGVSKTYDPKYVANGLNYENYFRKEIYKN